jgi:hypothetical protein
VARSGISDGIPLTEGEYHSAKPNITPEGHSRQPTVPCLPFKRKVYENLGNLFKFIANLFECDWQEVRDMDPIDLLDKLEQVADIEKWKNFFKRVAALMKKK